MKKLIAVFLLCAAMQVSALEMEGIKVDDTVQVENVPLKLNGAGVRSIVFFKMYVIGLYLVEKQQNADTILADANPKRIALHVMVGDAGTERFLNGFRKGMEKNHNEAQLSTLHERMTAFELMFGANKTVKRGDVIAFDWLPMTGTVVSLNGVELGRIAGDDFYRALLSIWIGNKPVSKELKKSLSGN